MDAASPSPWQAWRLRRVDCQGSESDSRHRVRSLGPLPRSPCGAALGEEPGPRQPHIPCLLREAVEHMLPPEMRRQDGTFDGTYADCTFGRGGHTREILSRLSPQARLFAFDVDPEAVAVARALEAEDPRFRILHRPFGDIAEVFEPGQLSGVLVDLGVSSPQLDDRHRGFSFQDDAPLDMRMNQREGVPAGEWLQEVSAEELAWVIHSYGENDDQLLAERIAEWILCKQREAGGGQVSTRRLADIVRKAKGWQDDHGMHPAKLTFQAIRVFLNQEMQQLERVLHGSFSALGPNGLCCLISFKRQEANVIRKFVREHEEPDDYLRKVLAEPRLCELFPLLRTDKAFTVRQVAEPIRPSLEELQRNWRARSSAVHSLRKGPRSFPRLHLGAAGVRGSEQRLKEPCWRPTFAGSPGAAAEVAAAEFLGAGGPGPRFVAPGPRPTPARSLAEERRDARVTKDFFVEYVSNEEGAVSGYLVLRRGGTVHVAYEGHHGAEAGWSYGLEAGGAHGWFPSDHVVLLGS